MMWFYRRRRRWPHRQTPTRTHCSTWSDMTPDDSDALSTGSPASPGGPASPDLFSGDSISSPDSFQTVDLGASYSPDDRPFETFYLPLLSRAVTYDRAVGYWSASELQYAAQGTAHFLANRSEEHTSELQSRFD